MQKPESIRLRKLATSFVILPSLFLLINAGNSHATQGNTDSFTLDVPVACTLDKTVSTEHQASVPVGTYRTDIGETAFNVICNDSNGFAIYAVGYSGDEFGNTTMVPTVGGAANAIATGVATSGDTSNWAMKLTAVAGDFAPTLETGFNAYHVIPSAYTKVASFGSNTDASIGSSFKSTYATFISTAQPADTYTGKVKYTVVHPASEEAPGKTISQLTYMQDFRDLSADDLATVKMSMADRTTYNLIDNRDNKTYQVAKLKDGNIWMAENLDLGRTTLSNDLTSDNTHLETNITITASEFNGWIKSSGTTSSTTAELISIAGTDATSGTPYGTLYNYCAASAGTVCAADDENNNDATSDICPAGWRLPTGGDSGEFKALIGLTDYNTNTKLRSSIVNGGAACNLAGIFSSSTPTSRDSFGSYWSSTMMSGLYMYVLHLQSIFNVPFSSGQARYTGNSVRCIAGD